MATWTKDELSRIGKADELRIACVRADGTLRPVLDQTGEGKPFTIWVGRTANDLRGRGLNRRGASDKEECR